MKMLRWAINAVALSGVFFLVSGCRTSGLEVVVGPSEREVAEEEEEAGESDAWTELATGNGWADEREEPQSISAGEATRAPGMNVRKEPEGARVRLEPAQAGRIVVLVFWSMDSWLTMSAIQHADLLHRRYGEAYDVKVVGIVENPETYHHAEDFLSEHSIEIDHYYGRFRALRNMARAVRRDIRYELPCFFLIDSRGRVRFSKLGFSPTAVTDELRGAEGLVVVENAPPGRRIEDYLQRLIREEL